MLYERWRQIAHTHRDLIALRDPAGGRQFTFGQLDAITERVNEVAPGIACARGSGAEFILETLKAWRLRRVLCPLEPGQAMPAFEVGLSEKIVHLKMTSATSGVPRLVAFTACQLMADAENIISTMGLQKDWPNLGVISLAHSYGFSNLVLPLLLHGIPLILLDSPLPEMVRQAADAERGVTVAAVPALWRAWHEADSVSSHIRLAISAGAPLPLGLEQAVFARAGLKIHNFYGSSECGGIAYDATSVPREDGACAGRAMKNVQVTISENGCLQVSGPAVGESYWPEPNDNLRQGIFRTSDLAEISQGLIYLRGRAGDQINVAGRKVPPEAIEKVLLTHPKVRDCVVFGVPSSDPQRVEEIVACVVPHEAVACENLRQFLLERLPGWQVPREWRLVDTLSPNARGKVSRAEWKKSFQSPDPTTP